MKLSDKIENLIRQMLTLADGGTIDLQRNELASQLGCSPSQINYVITTRFTNEHGYAVDSRRGGGGYIRITQKQMDRSNYLMHLVNAIGGSITAADAAVFIKNCLHSGAVSEASARLIFAAVSDKALARSANRDVVRADLLKNMLVSLI